MNNESILKAKEISHHYTNIAFIEICAFDFKINFGIASQVNGTTDTNIEYNNQVIMSPQHAKALLYALQENITQYETIFGNINIDPKKE